MSEPNFAAEAKRAYMRAWRKRNPDKVKAANDRYWKKKGEEYRKQEEKA